MATALAVSLCVVGLDAVDIAHTPRLFARSLVGEVDFSDLLLQGILSLLLFAGALKVDLSLLRQYRFHVVTLAFVSTSLSTLIVGVALWCVSSMLHLALTLPFCLLFGALISPTDPVAVMGLVRVSGSPPELETVIAGESLFNDGVGIVLFSLLGSVASTGHAPSVSRALLELLREAGGGVAFGAALGYILYRLLKSVDQYQVEILLMLGGGDRRVCCGHPPSRFRTACHGDGGRANR
ncbi:MAG TPA: cation:proton antiporter [Paraburkholderia sp.]|uniref:cation:proton antiporter domain-containing protein n=1 Tax=Paraburkholderia sp. TaxID=1926495 RepID=UPI002BF92C9F|nr:cation:proton antiporter [Paraburkholderia sp.]HTR10223.1 cation:proton antiporter [Paraburkholderia sp.]